MSDHEYFVGEAVQIFSKSRNRWVGAVIKEIDGNEAHCWMAHGKKWVYLDEMDTVRFIPEGQVDLAAQIVREVENARSVTGEDKKNFEQSDRDMQRSIGTVPLKSTTTTLLKKEEISNIVLKDIPEVVVEKEDTKELVEKEEKVEADTELASSLKAVNTDIRRDETSNPMQSSFATTPVHKVDIDKNREEVPTSTDITFNQENSIDKGKFEEMKLLLSASEAKLKLTQRNALFKKIQITSSQEKKVKKEKLLVKVEGNSFDVDDKQPLPIKKKKEESKNQLERKGLSKFQFSHKRIFRNKVNIVVRAQPWNYLPGLHQSAATSSFITEESEEFNEKQDYSHADQRLGYHSWNDNDEKKNGENVEKNGEKNLTKEKPSVNNDNNSLIFLMSSVNDGNHVNECVYQLEDCLKIVGKKTDDSNLEEVLSRKMKITFTLQKSYIWAKHAKMPHFRVEELKKRYEESRKEETCVREVFESSCASA
eukprot:g3816.t1